MKKSVEEEDYHSVPQCRHSQGLLVVIASRCRMPSLLQDSVDMSSWDLIVSRTLAEKQGQGEG